MTELVLDMLAPKEEQLKVLEPYLERASKVEEPEPLKVTPGSYTLVARVLVGWRGLFVPRRQAIAAKGALIYYRKLVGRERGKK